MEREKLTWVGKLGLFLMDNVGKVFLSIFIAVALIIILTPQSIEIEEPTISIVYCVDSYPTDYQVIDRDVCGLWEFTFATNQEAQSFLKGYFKGRNSSIEEVEIDLGSDVRFWKEQFDYENEWNNQLSDSLFYCKKEKTELEHQLNFATCDLKLKDGKACISSNLLRCSEMGE